jgi:HD-GYP domain-containing protein (c-di-GMP phosphodiesterase class II)
MRRIAVGDLSEGMTLAKAVVGDRGELLLNAEVPLSERYIKMLRDRGVAAVFIHDADTDDVELEDIVSERVRVTVTVNVCRVFDAMERAVKSVEGQLSAPDFARSARDHSSYHDLQRDIAELVDEVLAADVLTGMNTLRSFDNYQFLHSLDSTVTAVMLGRRLHLPHDDLARIASGCLLHDIGMVALDAAMLNRRERLSTEERDHIRAHPQIGYDMLRKLRPSEVIANHVAYQHHERQDGTGYPRGLHGHNRVQRAPVERGATGRVLLDAEIVSVADVYDALGSDRPYRAALPPDQVVRMLRRLAGGQLNREIVAQLISVLPIYPLGSEVMVVTGRHRHFRGIVARVHKEALDRPTVRLLWNAERARVGPFEIDLRATEDVIASVPLTGTEGGASVTPL